MFIESITWMLPQAEDKIIVRPSGSHGSLRRLEL